LACAKPSPVTASKAVTKTKTKQAPVGSGSLLGRSSAITRETVGESSVRLQDHLKRLYAVSRRRTVSIGFVQVATDDDVLPVGKFVQVAVTGKRYATPIGVVFVHRSIAEAPTAPQLGILHLAF